MDFKDYATETMDFIKKIEADGCRLPGSEEEKKACKNIQQEIVDRTGLTPKTEKFIFAPRASIGMINYLGWAAFVFTFIYYLGGAMNILATLGYIGILVFTFTQIVRYTGIWDFVFKQETAENIITELEPASGKVDYTIYLGAHYDSSWCWKLAAKNPDTALIKTGFGIIGILTMLALSLVRTISLFESLSINYRAFYIVSNILPIALLPGFFFVTQFTSQDKTIGAPGAMDNLSGIGINISLMKYFKQHPEELPENCKLVNVGFASEEAGLKGSSAFVKAHKNDPNFKNSYVINLDSIADPDHFEAITGDPWQGTKFDAKLIELTLEAMKETGIEKPGKIVNPIGGCDSTPFCKVGIPTLTIAAQNPRSTDYYHTYNDKSSRIEVSTLETGLTVTYKLIKKIGEMHK